MRQGDGLAKKKLIMREIGSHRIVVYMRVFWTGGELTEMMCETTGEKCCYV